MGGYEKQDNHNELQQNLNQRERERSVPGFKKSNDQVYLLNHNTLLSSHQSGSENKIHADPNLK